MVQVRSAASSATIDELNTHPVLGKNQGKQLDVTQTNIRFSRDLIILVVFDRVSEDVAPKKQKSSSCQVPCAEYSQLLFHGYLIYRQWIVIHQHVMKTAKVVAGLAKLRSSSRLSLSLLNQATYSCTVDNDGASFPNEEIMSTRMPLVVKAIFCRYSIQREVDISYC